MEKFLLYRPSMAWITSAGNGERPIGMRYDSRPGKNIFTIGGNESLRSSIENIAIDIFGAEILGPKACERRACRINVRYIVPLERKKFVMGLRKLRDLGYSIVRVHKLTGVFF